MRIAVLGAGVIGVATAWYLRQDGHEVQVIDRREGPGLETSFANGGQISADHAAPWAKPGVPWQALKWMLHEDSPLLFRPTLDVHQWLWLAQFMVDCLPSRADRHTTSLRPRAARCCRRSAPASSSTTTSAPAASCISTATRASSSPPPASPR